MSRSLEKIIDVCITVNFNEVSPVSCVLRRNVGGTAGFLEENSRPCSEVIELGGEFFSIFFV